MRVSTVVGQFCILYGVFKELSHYALSLRHKNERSSWVQNTILQLGTVFLHSLPYLVYTGVHVLQLSDNCYVMFLHECETIAPTKVSHLALVSNVNSKR